MKYRDRLLGKLNKKYTLQNKHLYKKFRNRAVNELRTSKVDYCKKYFTEHRDNIKMLWMVYDLLSVYKIPSLIIHLK